jgi:L-xylulokinase
VLGAPVDVPEGSELGAKGAALLASVACGMDSSVTAAAERTRTISRTVAPRRDQHDLYADIYQRYANFRNAILAMG